MTRELAGRDRSEGPRVSALPTRIPQEEVLIAPELPLAAVDPDLLVGKPHHPLDQRPAVQGPGLCGDQLPPPGAAGPKGAPVHPDKLAGAQEREHAPATDAHEANTWKTNRHGGTRGSDGTAA